MFVECLLCTGRRDSASGLSLPLAWRLAVFGGEASRNKVSVPAPLRRCRRTGRRETSSDWQSLLFLLAFELPEKSFPSCYRHRFPRLRHRRRRGKPLSVSCPTCEEVKGKLNPQGVPRACWRAGCGQAFLREAWWGVAVEKGGESARGKEFGAVPWQTLERTLAKGKVSDGRIAPSRRAPGRLSPLLSRLPRLV